MIEVGVIGYGYWGPNLVRNLAQCPSTNIRSVCDMSRDRLERARSLHPGIRTTTSADELIRDPAVSAVAIATPVGSHFELAMAALQAGKHVLVEKPITSSSEQALRLIEEAARRNLVLMVDHTFVYTGAVRKIREIVESGSIGELSYYDSTRINLGLFQYDVNVLWDLAVHDLSIMNYVIDGSPVAVSATGLSHISGRPENLAYLTIYFENLISHINVNWLSPVKIRRTLVGGSKQMIVYDDLETTEKVKVYDKGITVTESTNDFRQMMISYRTGDMWSPKVDETEALAVEMAHFADCINSGRQPLTGGEEGLELVRILEAANASLAQRGAPVEL